MRRFVPDASDEIHRLLAETEQRLIETRRFLDSVERSREASQERIRELIEKIEEDRERYRLGSHFAD